MEMTNLCNRCKVIGRVYLEVLEDLAKPLSNKRTEVAVKRLGKSGLIYLRKM
jgi:hypothetical protein